MSAEFVTGGCTKSKPVLAHLFVAISVRGHSFFFFCKRVRAVFDDVEYAEMLALGKTGTDGAFFLTFRQEQIHVGGPKQIFAVVVFSLLWNSCSILRGHFRFAVVRPLTHHNAKVKSQEQQNTNGRQEEKFGFFLPLKILSRQGTLKCI